MKQISKAIAFIFLTGLAILVGFSAYAYYFM